MQKFSYAKMQKYKKVDIEKWKVEIEQEKVEK